jgi:hypothetical protein
MKEWWLRMINLGRSTHLWDECLSECVISNLQLLRWEIECLFFQKHSLSDLFHIKNSENRRIREQWCHNIHVTMMFWFIVYFSFYLLTFSKRLNPSRIQFPFTNSSGLIILHWGSPWRGKSKSAQTLPFMSALVSMSHWVSQAVSRRLDGPFPPFLALLQ